MKQKIYISGKVSGLSKNEVIAKFTQAEKHLESKGYQAVNPIKYNDWDTDWSPAMRKCIKILMDCDYIYLLDDYKKSKGAMIELQLAKHLGIPVLYSSLG